MTSHARPSRHSGFRGNDGVRRHSAENGFTLIELMVALFIFAMLAAAGVALLSFGVRAQAAAATRLDAVGQTQRMANLLANDLAQVVPRLTRGADGLAVRAFTGNDGAQGTHVLGYVRGGWSNPDALVRSSLQRVEVAVEGNRLIRRGYSATDGDASASAMLLADKVASVAVRYRDIKGDWRTRWDDPIVTSMPRAVEVTLTFERDAPLTLAFLVGTR